MNTNPAPDHVSWSPPIPAALFSVSTPSSSSTFNALAALAAERARIRVAAAEIGATTVEWEAEKQRLSAEHEARINTAEAELRQRNVALRTASELHQRAKKELADLSAQVLHAEEPERLQDEASHSEIEERSRLLAVLARQIPVAAQEAQQWTAVAQQLNAVMQQQRVVAAERQHCTENLQAADSVLKELRRRLQHHQHELEMLEQKTRSLVAPPVAPFVATAMPALRHGAAPALPPALAAVPVPVAALPAPVAKPNPVAVPSPVAVAASGLTPHRSRMSQWIEAVRVAKSRLAAGAARTLQRFGAWLPRYRVAPSTLRTAVLVLALGAIGWAFGFFFLGFGSGGEMAVRVVANQDFEAVAGASVVLFFEGGPVAQYTDAHGASTLILDRARGRRGRLVVEKEGFRIHQQEVHLKDDAMVEIRLVPPDPLHADVLVRAVDSATGEPIARAEVLILAGSDRFTELTDAHGLGRFTLGFLDSKLNAEMSISSRHYALEHNRVTLLPDKVQDISLDRAAAQLRVGALDLGGALFANFRDTDESRLRPGTRAVGGIRQGTDARYSFSGQRNKPVVFQVQRTAGELGYRVEIYDPEGAQVAAHGPYRQGAHTLAFTPQEGGVYGVSVRGVERGGNFVIALSNVSEASTQRKSVVRLSPGRSERGMLAAGSWHDFTFEGVAHTPCLFKLQRSMGELGYFFAIYDRRGNQLARYGRFSDGLQIIPFTPTTTGTYTARLQGTQAHGGYALTLSGPASAEDANLVPSLSPDPSALENVPEGVPDPALAPKPGNLDPPLDVPFARGKRRPGRPALRGFGSGSLPP